MSFRSKPVRYIDLTGLGDIGILLIWLNQT